MSLADLFSPPRAIALPGERRTHVCEDDAESAAWVASEPKRRPKPAQPYPSQLPEYVRAYNQARYAEAAERIRARNLANYHALTPEQKAERNRKQTLARNAGRGVHG